MPLVLPVVVIDFLVFATVFVVLWYCTRAVLVPLVSEILAAIPVIGGFIRDRTLQLISIAENWVAARVQGMVAYAVQTAIRIETRIRGIIESSLDVLTVATAAIEHTVEHLLPLLYQQATAYVESRISDAVHFVQAAVADAEKRVGVLLHALEAEFQRELAGVARDVAGVEAAIGVSEAAAIAASSAITAEALKLAQQGITDAENAARALVADAEAIAAADAARVLAAATALTVPLALDIAKIKDLPCIKACEPLGALGGLLDGLELGGILALVAVASRDPKGAIGMVEEAMAPIVREGAALLKDVTG